MGFLRRESVVSSGDLDYTLDVGNPLWRFEMQAVLKEYDAKLDSKNRFSIRGSKYEYYHVTEFEDGHIELRPRVLVEPFEISANTLKMIDQSMENLKKGWVSEPIDLSPFREQE